MKLKDFIPNYETMTAEKIAEFLQRANEAIKRGQEKEVRDERTRKMLAEDPLTVFGLKRKTP